MKQTTTTPRRRAHFAALANRYEIPAENLAAFIKSAYYYERLLHFFAVWECNGRDDYGRRYTEETERAQSAAEARARRRLVSLCGNKDKAGDEFRTNRDPRGYALKFEPANRYEVAGPIVQDWGGYICTAPEFRPDSY